MSYFSSFDYVIIAFYFVFLIALGVYLKKRASASMEDYFLGGRQMPWYFLGLSGMAWSLDITGTMLIVSLLYMVGPRGLFIEFRGGANLVLIFMMLWTGKWHRRSGCMTGAEWNIYRFGAGAGGNTARLITACAMITNTVGMLAYMVKGDGMFLATFLNKPPFLCALVMIGIATIYTIMSGFYGVIFTDLFQMLIVFVAVAAITVIAIGHIHGYEGNLADLAEKVTGLSHWNSSAPSWRLEMPKGYEGFDLLFMVACFYLLRNVMAGMGMGADPRYFGARNERECGLLTFFWSCLMTFRWPMMIGFAVMGLFLMGNMFPDQSILQNAAEVIKKELPGIPKSRWNDVVAGIASAPERYPHLVEQLRQILREDWTEKLKMLSYEGTVNPERVLPAVLLNMIPRGLRGLIFVAFLAASMSTFNTFVNTTTAFFTRDVYQAYLRPRAANRELMFTNYVFGVALVACGLALGYSTSSINNIWDWLVMGLGAGIGIPALLRLYWWRFNAGGMVIGIAVGLVAAVIQHVHFPDLGPWQKFSILTAISLAGTVIGTYATRPTDRKVLEHFYKTTRPFGLWGPLRAVLSAEQRRAMNREHVYDVICVPFGLAWQVTMFLMPMQLIIGEYRAFACTLPVFLLCLVVLYKYWYKKLPPAEPAPATPPLQPHD